MNGSAIGRGTLALGIIPAMLIVGLVPPLIMLIAPMFLAGFIIPALVNHTPKPRPATFETWWDDNYQDFL